MNKNIIILLHFNMKFKNGKTLKESLLFKNHFFFSKRFKQIRYWQIIFKEKKI